MPDVIIIATGATAINASVLGIKSDHNNVFTSHDVLGEKGEKRLFLPKGQKNRRKSSKRVEHEPRRIAAPFERTFTYE